MKKIIVSVFIIVMGAALTAQDLPKAMTKGAVRLFGDKDDLTSVLVLIPDSSIVEVVTPDTLFTRVVYEGLDGFVKSDALTEDIPVTAEAPVSEDSSYTVPEQQEDAVQQQNFNANRYQMLADKYGAELGKLLYQHKVWKGISSDMARDSWGKPKQINRMYVDNSVDEEWIYSKKYLYFRDGTLIEWGPVNQ